jgi:epoxyqueuosine reductase
VVEEVTLTEQIKEEARRLGFDAVGIAPVDEPMRGRLRDRLKAWLTHGYHGTMQWMERNPGRRSDPRQVLPGCRSIVCVGLNYYTDHRPDESAGHGKRVDGRLIHHRELPRQVGAPHLQG